MLIQGWGGEAMEGEQQRGDSYICDPHLQSMYSALSICTPCLLCAGIREVLPTGLSHLYASTMYKKLSENERVNCVLRVFAPEESACLYKILSDSFHLSQEARSPAGPRKYENWHFVGLLPMVTRCWSPVCHERSEFVR